MALNPVLFDGYIAVDWSSTANPCQGANSIWIAVCGPYGPPEVHNPATRRGAMDLVDGMLTEAAGKGHRFLSGFDFPFGFPEGTAQMLTGEDSWEAVWRLIAGEIEDGDDNQNDRFDAAARLNEHFPGEGPFWGNGLNHDIQGLGRTAPRNRWGANLPPYRRHVERVFPGQEVWKLSGRGSVGSQALTGIARLEWLRQHRDDVQVWPFQGLGKERRHVLAEIYPSLIEPCPVGDVLDEHQVRAVAVRLRELDHAGELAVRLRAPENMPEAVRREEGLFLDITQNNHQPH